MSNRHTFLRLSVSAVIAIIGISLSMLSYAATGDTVTETAGTGSLTIEQKNSFTETLGKWTLLRPDQTQLEGGGAVSTINATPAGLYTLLIKVPNGMMPTIRIYRGLEQIQFVQRPQVAFKVADKEHLGISIHYTLTRTGMLSVQSDPPGLTFTVKGPNDTVYTGVTPMSFPDSPVGQYSARYETLQGCVTPPPQNDQLVEKGRVTFSVTLSCPAADKIRSRQQTKSEEYVVIRVNGNDVTLRDVPQSAWYASHVYDAARKGVLAGYNDDNGQPSGLYGPGNDVSVAELSKIAHRLAGISEEPFAGIVPDNLQAQGTWFAPFFASAEQQGWTIFNDATIDPARPATRAEVVVTFLQALDIPLRWQKGRMFTDVTRRTQYAAAIETAAEDGIIEGRTDETGTPLHLFAPLDPINRAEIAAIISNVFEIYKKE